MLPAAQALMAELDQEADTTRRILARVPGDRLEWRPHQKSMSLGQLAQHIATIPGSIARLGALDGFDAAQARFEPAMPDSAEALMPTLDASLESMRALLGGLTETTAHAPWRFTHGDREVFTVARLGLIRSLAMNHWYHHRGQLTVYLRLLDVPVPVIYGRSADDNPFAS